MALDSGNRSSVVGGVETLSNFAWDVIIDGNIAYVAYGPGPWVETEQKEQVGGLQVVDISNPENPQIIAVVETIGPAFSMALQNDHLFIAGGNNELQVVDVSNPNNPQKRTSGKNIAPDKFKERHVKIHGGMAYVADADNGLCVIDISDTAAPQPLYSKTIGAYAKSVDFKNNYAFVTGRPGRANNGVFVVLDITDPSDMVLVRSITMPTWYVQNVTVVGDYAYVATTHSGIQVVDISDPENPSIVHDVDTSGRAWAITFSGQTAYVADELLGVAVLDVTDPTAILELGTIDTPNQALNIALKEDYAYVADGEGGLQVVDVKSPRAQNVISRVPTPGVSQYFDVKDDRVYIGDQEGGMLVIDISNFSSPSVIGQVDTNDRARHVDVVGNVAYVADRKGGLQVVNIDDPTDPYIMGSYNLVLDTTVEDHWARFVTIDGNYAYIANGADVLILNVSNPSNPTFVKSVGMLGFADGRIAVKGGYAYAPDKVHGSVAVIDVRVPASASIVARVDTPGTSSDEGPKAKWVTIAGDKAYVANGAFGISVFDINPSTPTAPTMLGSLSLPSLAHSLSIDGNTAFVANGDAGVQVVDVSNPANMMITGTADTTGGSVCLYVKDGLVFVSDFGNGCIVVPLPVEIKPVSFNPPDQLSCTLPSPSISGHYILRVFNDNGDIFDLDGAVTFSDDVRDSRAIIVAGGDYITNQDRKLEEEFQQVANEAYQAFLYQGFRREDILYLGPDLSVDADGNGAPDDVDELNSIPNIQAAFNTWAVSQSPQDIFVYLVGHGSVGYYKPNSQRVMADEVKAWIDGLKDLVSGDVIFIYEACHSGAILLNMDESPGNSPVVITSSKSSEPAWFYKKNGRLISFSSGFWNSVLSREGARLDTAFISGKINIKNEQTAWMDTNGDLKPNTSDDKTEILVVGRGYQPGREIPAIGSVSGSQSLDGNTSANLWATGITTPDGGPAEVFALITPPCHNPEHSVPVTEGDADLDEVELTDDNDDGVYEGSYDGFSIPGTYTITIRAMDSQGKMSDPRETYVYQSSGRDEFEFDNSYLQAREITLNGDMAQCRNFYDANDEDWVKFFGLAGNIYLVEASSLGPDNNVVIEIYDIDGTTLLTLLDDPTNTRADEALYWRCTEDGLYYARIRPAGSENTGKETDYRLEIYRPVAELFGSIAGTVKNNAGEPVEGVTVKTNVGASGVSKEGTYFMVHREGNGFLMTMKANGYQQKDIPDIDVDEAKTTFVHVSLDPTFVNTVPTIAIVSPASNVTLFEGESVNFQSFTTNGNAPFKYAWDFSGGAANTTDENPGDVTFASQGVYTVKVTVEDVDKDEASAEITITVNKNTDPASVPDVSITSPVANKTIVAGQSVNFQASLKLGNAPFDYTWDFNGGAANASVEDPGNVVFSTPGIYTVRVTVKDNEDDQDSAEVTVTVVADSKPVATIQSPATNVAVDAGGTVNFQGSVTGGNLPLAYTWDFDGAATASTAEDPGDVTFSDPGTYTITFTVTDANGDVHSDTVTITVNSGGNGGGGCFLTTMLP